MTDRHWFDELHRTLTEQAPRRGLLRSAGALFAGLTLGATTPDALGKKNRKKAGKKDRKDKNDKKRDDRWGCRDRFEKLRIKDPVCSAGACNAQWPNDPCEEKYCEFICNQCDEDDSREFCITGVFGDREATCCPEGSTCCAGGGRDRLVNCCPKELTCCGGSCCGLASSNGRTACCQGNCRNIDRDPDHCGGCSNPCGVGEVCEAGFCVLGPNDPDCDVAECPYLGQQCIDGRCRCPEGEAVCNGSCTTDYQPCTWVTQQGPIPICIPPDWSCCPAGYACPEGSRCCPRGTCYQGRCPE